MDTDLFVYMIVRDKPDSTASICVDSWDTALHALSELSGTDDKVMIIRYKVCSKK